MNQVRTITIALVGSALVLVTGTPAMGQNETPPLANEPASVDSNVSLGSAKTAYDRYEFEKAYRQYLLLAEAGDPEAQFYLGWMHVKGQGVTQDYVQTFNWFRKSADQGFAGAQYNLAWMYEKGLGVAQDGAQAEVWYRRAAEQGLVSPGMNFAKKLERDGNTGNDAQALEWFLKVIDRCHASLQSGQVIMYFDRDVGSYFSQARERVSSAAEQGDALAQFNLGSMYEKGRCIRRDNAKALKWYRMAAAQGQPDAQVSLGAVYYLGEGVPQDYAKAVSLFRDAAEQGHPKAQFLLGYAYQTAQGVPRDDAAALIWIRKAARQGLAAARNNLGLMYYEGQGVARDDVMAYMLFSLAAEEGDKTIMENRDSMAQEMTPADIAKAQKLARVCATKDYIGCF